MRKIIPAIIATAFMASAAQAETFTYTVDFGAAEFVGGMGESGREGRGGTMSGPYATTFASGATSSGQVECVGMDQPSNSLFDVHLACEATDSDGDTVSIIYGCNYMDEDNGLSCVGGIEARSGENKGARGSLTMHLQQGTSIGTGQWYE